MYIHYHLINAFAKQETNGPHDIQTKFADTIKGDIR